MNIDDSPIMKMAQAGKAEDLKEDLRARAQSSLYYFTKVVLGYDKLVPHFHQELTTHIQNSIPIKRRGYLAPRGHFKSTVISKSYALWRLCGGGKHLRPDIPDPRDMRIAIVGESDSVAGKNLKDIKWNIENNQLLRWLFPEIIPSDINNTKWAENEILLPRSHSFDESTITTFGVGTKKTGFHFDMIIYDDIVGEKSAQSDALMAEAIEYIQYAPGLLADPEKSEELIAGTRWRAGEADPYGWLMKHMPPEVSSEGRHSGFTWYIRSAIETDPETGEDKLLFPERFTFAGLEEIRKREKNYKFSCQYLNRPSTPEDADFPEEQFKTFRVEKDSSGQLTLCVPEDGTAPVRLSQMLRMSFYDPSAGGKSAGCENAIVVGGEAADRRIFIYAAWSRNCSMHAAVEVWHILNDQYKCYRNHYEWVGAQKEIENIVGERRWQIVCRICKKEHQRIYPIGVKPPGNTNKEDRVRGYLQAAMAEGRVYFRQGLVELIRQGTNFPHGDLVDQFDALAYLVHLLRPPLSDEQILEVQAAEELRKELPSSRTYCEHNPGGYI